MTTALSKIKFSTLSLRSSMITGMLSALFLQAHLAWAKIHLPGRSLAELALMRSCLMFNCQTLLIGPSQIRHGLKLSPKARSTSEPLSIHIQQNRQTQPLHQRHQAAICSSFHNLVLAYQSYPIQVSSTKAWLTTTAMSLTMQSGLILQVLL